MSKFDQMIAQALSAEDQALLASHSEPGYFKQAFGIFRGPMSWVMWLVYVVCLIAAAFCAYALWQLYQTSDVLIAVKYGVAGLLAFQFTLMGKSFMGAHLEANRMLREIKRVELQLSLLRGRD